MGTNVLAIKMVNTPEEAPNYKEPEYKGASLDSAVIVGNGTVQGGATVDLIFTDSSGQKYMAMITGALIKSLSSAVAGVESRSRPKNSDIH